MANKNIVVIGSGFAGLSAAAFLAKAGHKVTVVEKFGMPGGRARKFVADGFTFDMGPSWYWMPDVFERFFACFNKKPSDYYELIRLDPSYKVFWQNDEAWEIPADYQQLKNLFERIEPGAASHLDAVMAEAAYKYKIGVEKLVYKPGQSLLEFADKDLLKGLLKLDVFNNIRKHFARHFKHPNIRELLEFPSLFLGALPQNTPALYSLMNYADIKGGTWFPVGGMHKIAEAMHLLAEELGVEFLFNSNVSSIKVSNKRATDVEIHKQDDKRMLLKADAVVSNADYEFTERCLLPATSRNYSEKYWNSRVMAPSCLIFYVGISKKIDGLQHHSLFFDTPFDAHARNIYEDQQWPERPLFYVSATSVTDSTQAPAGCENLFFLIPIAAGIKGDSEEIRRKYFELVAERFENRLNTKIRDSIIFYRSYCVTNFIEDYNAYKGNAYGLANTLMQTAILKPSAKNKKVENLFYTGQLTVPGPGVPPALISGEVVAGMLNKIFE